MWVTSHKKFACIACTNLKQSTAITFDLLYTEKFHVKLAVQSYLVSHST